MPFSDNVSFSETMENLLIVTHSVPVERVMPYVPEELVLDIVEGPEKEDVALVSVTCFLNRDMKWADDEEAYLDFHQCNYQTYVRHGGLAGTYVFGSYIERGTPFIFRRLSMAASGMADFDISLSYDSAKRAYKHFHCEVTSDTGDTLAEVKSGGEAPLASTPFSSGEATAKFITERCAEYFTSADGSLSCMKMEFGDMNPVRGELLQGEFELWEDMGILREEEFVLPYSVIIQPSVDVTGCSPEKVDG